MSNNDISSGNELNCKFIVVGITGPLGSGKGTVAEILRALAIEKGFCCIYESLSDEIRKELKKQNIEINRDNQREIANRYRNEFGTHIWAQKAASEVILQLKKVSNCKGILIIVDAIRNPGEVNELQHTFGENFSLAGVIAPDEKIKENILRRRRQDESTRIEHDSGKVLSLLAGEMGTGEPIYGHNVSECIEMTDLPLIENDGSLDLLHQKVSCIANQFIFPKLE